MARKGHIERYTAKELAANRRASRSDWEKAAAIGKQELEASIAAGPDEVGMVMDWDSATIELPKPKTDLHMRIDGDVLDFFRSTGKGYRTRINAVLRSYVSRMRNNRRQSQRNSI
jgi:uncharacterized protein (DUF4415 family)